MDLFGFPHVRLTDGPTPLQPLETLTKILAGPRILIKRDDCTQLAMGGNKTRKLEFELGEALRLRASSIVATGVIQSNFIRQTAAACAKLGLDCHLVLEKRVSGQGEEYARSGNFLLDRLFGARVERIASSAVEASAAMAELMQKLVAEGKRPYRLPNGASSPLGSLGYVRCAQEILGQLDCLGVKRATVVHASSGGGTQTGLLAGFHQLQEDIKVVSISVTNLASVQVAKVSEMLEQTKALLNLDGPSRPVEVNDAYIGQGYGACEPDVLEAVELIANREGILLDPVYTGKAMAGLIHMVRGGVFSHEESVVFIHTGGTPALFAYRKQIEQHLAVEMLG